MSLWGGYDGIERRGYAEDTGSMGQENGTGRMGRIEGNTESRNREILPDRASAFTFFQSFFAHFFRLCRKKPGYPGFRFAPFPPLTFRERFAPLLSLAPRKIFTLRAA
jgi:hypothetical protein